jgi:hypothetical protein
MQFISTIAIGCGMESSFAEMRYAIDSSNQYIIHITIITTDTWYCPNGLDSAKLFGFFGGYKNIPLIDTANVEDGYILKTYQGAVLIDTLASDSIAYVSYSVPYRHTGIVNIGPIPMNLGISINYKGISKVGIASPEFNGPRISDGIWNDTLVYNPFISYSNADSVFVDLKSENGGYEFPYTLDKGAYPTDTIYLNDTSGILTWVYPRDEGYYDILYQANQYRNGNYIGYIQRDMLLYISPDSTTGIPSISSGGGLKCYPSPTSGSFTIDMTGYDAGEKHISIYNELGQVVYQTLSTQDKLEVSEKLPSGVYIVAVSQGAIEYSRIVFNQ